MEHAEHTDTAISLDFGNYKLKAAYIDRTRTGPDGSGECRNLDPSEHPDGVSSFFAVDRHGNMRFGADAERPKNGFARVARLKSHIGEAIAGADGKPFLVNDTSFRYDTAVTATAEAFLKGVNERLGYMGIGPVRDIFLSYPAGADFGLAKLTRFVRLINSATLEDGTNFRVRGTICEPAAAALNFLASMREKKPESKVLEIDVGGGTFDMALLTAYPDGKENVGAVRYYDIVACDGIPDIGGLDFSDRLTGLLLSKAENAAGGKLTNAERTMLCRMTEDVKRRLSVSESADVSDLMHGGEFLEINVTRAEFEAESRDLLSRIGERASALLRRNPDFIPEHVVLCGGASKMPMIGETLRAALPEYADRFAVFEPELSVCYGTARYAAMEINADETSSGDPADRPLTVLKRTRADIGIEYCDETKKPGEPGYLYIHRLIRRGTVIPCAADEVRTCSLNEDSDRIRIKLFEATTEDPDDTAPERDWESRLELELGFGGEMPRGTKIHYLFGVDGMGLGRLEAWLHDDVNRSVSGVISLPPEINTRGVGMYDDKEREEH